MNIAILILAAGNSSRMKTPKQLLPIGSTTLLGLTIKNAIQSKAGKIFCVLGSEFDTVKKSIKDFDIEIINNLKYKSGLSSSIVEGIKHIRSQSFDAALIMLADQPNVNSSYINNLIDNFGTNQIKIVASKYKDNLGVPAIFPKQAFNDLLKLKGDKGAKDYLKAKKTSVVTIDSVNFTDIDTPKDYKNYLNTL